jgi:hypothetical protein
MEETKTLSSTTQILGRFQRFEPIRTVPPYMIGSLTYETLLWLPTVISKMAYLFTVKASDLNLFFLIHHKFPFRLMLFLFPFQIFYLLLMFLLTIPLPIP